MTYERQGYVLADKLRNRFVNRGADVNGMRASSTEELMRRAEMGRDPRENCAEQAFRENYREYKNTPNRVDYSSRSYAESRTGSGYSRGAQNNRRAENRAYTAQQSRTYESGAKRSAPRGYESGRARTESTPRTRAKASAKAKNDGRVKIAPSEEIREKKKLISPVFLACLLAGTVMVMFLVTEISNVYRAAGEVSTLENELSATQREIDELELKLDEKNDVRTIEKIATEELGMTKEDTLQRRYVSISDGERIEVLDSGEEEKTAGGVVLSSILSSLGELFGGSDN